jgi:hypothetical protein
MTRASGSTRASSRTPWRARRGDAVRAFDQCRSRTNFIARSRIRRRALRGRAFLCVAGRHPKRAVSRVCSAAAFRRDSSPTSSARFLSSQNTLFAFVYYKVYTRDPLASPRAARGCS